MAAGTRDLRRAWCRQRELCPLGFALAGLVAALTPACVCAREADRVDGTIDGPTPLTTPIGSKPACVVRIEGAYYDLPVSRDRSERSAPRYAPQATFTVADRTLALVGDGGAPLGFEHGETWRWTKGQRPPAGLQGYDKSLDVVLRCTEPDAGCRMRNIRFSEQLIPCGAEMSLRGEIRGDTFVLRQR